MQSLAGNPVRAFGARCCWDYAREPAMSHIAASHGFRISLTFPEVKRVQEIFHPGLNLLQRLSFWMENGRIVLICASRYLPPRTGVKWRVVL